MDRNQFNTQKVEVKDSLHGGSNIKGDYNYDDNYANQVFKFHSSGKDAEEESDSGEDWDYGSEEETPAGSN